MTDQHLIEDLQYRNNRQAALLHCREKLIMQLQEDIEQREKDIGALDAEIDQQDDEIGEKNDKLEEQRIETEFLKTEVKQLSVKNKDLQGIKTDILEDRKLMIGLRDDEILKQRREIQEHKRVILVQKQKIRDLDVRYICRKPDAPVPPPPSDGYIALEKKYKTQIETLTTRVNHWMQKCINQDNIIHNQEKKINEQNLNVKVLLLDISNLKERNINQNCEIGRQSDIASALSKTIQAQIKEIQAQKEEIKGIILDRDYTIASLEREIQSLKNIYIDPSEIAYKIAKWHTKNC